MGCQNLPMKFRREPKFLVSNEQVEPSVPAEDGPVENSITLTSGQRGEAKERSSMKIKKKVRFNMNVVIHEIVPHDEETTCQSLESKEKEDEGKGKTAPADASLCLLPSVRDSTAPRMGSGFYPSDYQYKNCRDSYVEENELELNKSVLACHDADAAYDYDDDNISEEEFSQQLCSVRKPVENFTQWRAVKARAMLSLKHQGKENLANSYMHSVRIPIENLTQWRVAKASVAPLLKQEGKENQEQIPPSLKSCFYLSTSSSAESFISEEEFSVRKPVENITQWRAVKERDAHHHESTNDRRTLH
ncbi:uncharacterized protein LOC131152244 [Malania oleifera]|uniref:uncharacterized protein LOC131152244 n=1 Tax=Malania oleifera TaxID=397392 RepID=UPI0025AE094A|nr:uncharacterized protein LOC131152244 [Malania oleifera]